MSQHDFNIANATASTVRSDLNAAFVALAEQSSGATEPTTTYANQMWYEIDTNWLYQRNEANSAWIRFAYLDQSGSLSLLKDTKIVAIDGTQEGILGDQAQSVWNAGTSLTDSLCSPANIKGAIDANSSAGQTYNVQEFTSSGTWSRPSGYLVTDEVWVWVVGGGGGGGASSNANDATGGNGGVGIYKRFEANLLGTTEVVTVGAGGGARADGGNSEFGTSGNYGYIRGEGGNHGDGGDQNPADQSLKMFDTSKGANSTILLGIGENPWFGYSSSGTFASNGISSTIYGGGAGSAGGSTTGGGFSAWGGQGGQGDQNNAASGNGSFPSGGGGGNDSDQGEGGDGGNGIVVVYTKRTIL